MGQPGPNNTMHQSPRSTALDLRGFNSSGLVIVHVRRGSETFMTDAMHIPTNPYKPPLSNAEDLGPAANVIIPVAFRDWMVFVAVELTRAICFGAFVFFILLQVLGVFVNWPNVIYLLGVAFLILALLFTIQNRLLHNRFAAWRYSAFGYSAGAFFGVVAVTCVLARLI
jgi:hypothetical protein